MEQVGSGRVNYPPSIIAISTYIDLNLLHKASLKYWTKHKKNWKKSVISGFYVTNQFFNFFFNNWIIKGIDIWTLNVSINFLCILPIFSNTKRMNYIALGLIFVFNYFIRESNTKSLPCHFLGNLGHFSMIVGKVCNLEIEPYILDWANETRFYLDWSLWAY